MKYLSLLAALASGCCISGIFSKDDTQGSPAGESEADADTDSDADGDGDVDTDADADHTFPAGEPSFEAMIGGERYNTEDGYWFDSGTAGFVLGTRDGGAIRLELEIEGHTTFAGTYPVGDVQYAQTQAHSIDFRYQGTGGATFTVEGHDAEQEHIWGSLDGPITLTDSVSGGTATLDSLVVESWPRF
jgi:hypothetical protein